MPAIVFIRESLPRYLYPMRNKIPLSIIFVTAKGTPNKCKTAVPIPLTPPVDNLMGTRNRFNPKANDRVPKIIKK